jgi:diguanylate cyclase (GGDEF)-like protein
MLSTITPDIDDLLLQIEVLLAENARLKRDAYTDGLTGIANRRAFDTTLEQEWSRCSRTQSPIALLLIDIDFFKKYNDTHGHDGGDELLRGLATAWKAIALRTYDLVARYGGEEFAVILPNTDAIGASRVAEEFAKAAHTLKVTVSIGVKAIVPCDHCPKSLIRSADAALYRSKSEGRDRVTVG